MYLSRLEEKQKHIFLDFIYCLASSDGQIDLSERELIEAYCEEMNIEKKDDFVLRTYEDIIKDLNQNFELEGKKIVIFESIGLAMVDGEYDQKERELVKKTLECLAMDSNYGSQCEAAISEYLLLQKKINNLILG